VSRPKARFVLTRQFCGLRVLRHVARATPGPFDVHDSVLATGETWGAEHFDSLHIENRAVLALNIGAHSQWQRLVYMFRGRRNHLDAGVLPLSNAVFCLDCEVISSSRGDECAACKSRSLLTSSDARC